MNNVVVAMDGPSGSGKSSTARGVATRLGLRYLDTGAMYRALTHWMLTHQVDLTSPEAIADRAGEALIGSGTDPQAPTITVDDEDVSVPIRGEAVTRAVSAVSAVPEVRTRMVELQRALIGDGGIVVEGRDIGTVVVPDAAVKLFLTADPAARAARRAAEQRGEDLAATQADLARRDTADSGRATSPLAMAEDAVHIDTTAYTLDEVVDEVVRLVQSRAGHV